MAEKRETLTKLLVTLMDAKAERAQELQSRMTEMEESRGAEQDNYWLIQFQKLMDAKPKVIRGRVFITGRLSGQRLAKFIKKCQKAFHRMAGGVNVIMHLFEILGAHVGLGLPPLKPGCCPILEV